MIFLRRDVLAHETISGVLSDIIPATLERRDRMIVDGAALYIVNGGQYRILPVDGEAAGALASACGQRVSAYCYADDRGPFCKVAVRCASGQDVLSAAHFLRFAIERKSYF